MNSITQSPFHRGEQAIQERFGLRERMEQFGRQVIVDYLPQQHRNFYQQLPYVLAGHADPQGQVWASMLFSQSQLMTSPHPEVLDIHANPVAGDPLNKSWKAGTYLGLLGIELATKRRNRIAAHIKIMSENGVSLSIDQAFGNCPQYIHPRKLRQIDPASMPAAETQKLNELDSQAQQLIAQSDTFFVASHVANGTNEASQGADVSHRGGDAGFVRIDDVKTLMIPDYAGNRHFNTLGNFIENSKAGLLFIDFENGHLLTLTGTVEILWDSEETASFPRAERLWRFTLDHGYWLKNVLPMRWESERLLTKDKPVQVKKVMQKSKPEPSVELLLVAEKATVVFSVKKLKKEWTDDDGTLLEFAEEQGLKPKFGCRSGVCGMCKVPLISGEIVYEKEISAPVNDGEILLCCAVPAESNNGVTRLEIEL